METQNPRFKFAYAYAGTIAAIYGFMRSDAENFAGMLIDAIIYGLFFGVVGYFIFRPRKGKDFSGDPKLPELIAKYDQKTTDDLKKILNSSERYQYTERARFVMKKIVDARMDTSKKSG